MTRSQRRARSLARRRNAQHTPGRLAAPAVATVRVGREWIESHGVRMLVPVTERIELADNPNEVKRGAARLDFMGQFVAELARDTARAYSPLTVTTPVLTARGKPGKRSTSYTV